MDIRTVNGQGGGAVGFPLRVGAHAAVGAMVTGAGAADGEDGTVLLDFNIVCGQEGVRGQTGHSSRVSNARDPRKHKHTHTHTDTSACTCTHTHTHTHICMHMHTHTHTHICMHMHTHTHTHTHSHTHICMHMHTHTHTHTHTHAQSSPFCPQRI